MTTRGLGTSVAALRSASTREATMSDSQKNPKAGEWAYPMTSETDKHANSPAATGADPQAQAAQRPGGGGAPGTGQGEDMSEEAKNQWAGAKGPTQSGKA
jgi:hypothetical protein